MKSFSTLLFFLMSFSLFGQYIEEFTTASRGILSGPCGATATTCNSFDFAGVEWTIGGDLSGIDSEGFSTTGGALLTSDSDERACWISPTLDISAVGSASIVVSFSIPGSSTDWDNSGNVDFMDVDYSVDGGAFTTIPNVNGCLANGHTVSGFGCTALTGGSNFSPTATGIIGNTIDIHVCIDTNGSTESGQINSVSVPEAGATILPVEWVHFKATPQGDKVQLEWATVSEVNNDYFQVERSTNGKNFKSIGKVVGKGNSFQSSAYNFLDSDLPAAAELYYRLRQVDFDGTFAKSEVVVVDNKTNSKNIRIYPNPVDGFSTVQVESALTGELEVSVMDVQGKVHLSDVVNSESGKWELETAALPAGTYMLTIQGIDRVWTKRFVKMND